MSHVLDLAQLQAMVRDFANERGWMTVNTGKNLAMALNVEAGELLEHFQWLTADDSDQFGERLPREKVEEEMADVLIYLLQLADRLDVDLLAAGFAKVERNAIRYPLPEAPHPI
jgi:NTP pyrophosphatase (non-canonical NTP hydrolase)